MDKNRENPNQFEKRQIGPRETDLREMLKVVQTESLDSLIDETIPADIRFEQPLNIPEPFSEYEYLKEVKKLAAKNKLFKSYIGMGFYNTITPPVIQRMILENPGWYTQYTPYQAEISQGRLEALLVFQTMVMDLTGMEVANASLLDEGTGAAEAMAMLFRLRSRELKKSDAHRFFISDTVYNTTLDVIRGRAEPLGIEIVVGDHREFEFDDRVFGALVQYPAEDGAIIDYSDFIQKAHRNTSLVAVAADLLSLTLLKPPGEMDADAVVGLTQRFGVPLGYGGPHAAYFATREQFVRQMPGRIIGVSVDRFGNKATRMALQTREQHIRREKATSNICTAQALLAIMAAMYAVYHGPEGLKSIARKIHSLTTILDREVSRMGLKQVNPHYFDTVKIKIQPELAGKIREQALNAGMNFRYIDSRFVGISLDETTCETDIQKILDIFARAAGKKGAQMNTASDQPETEKKIPASLQRTSDFLTHPVFHSYHSETEMMRYLKRLENKDLSLTTSMISLGSCTMKLNSAAAMFPVTWPEFAEMHPFVPLSQAGGYQEMIRELEDFLCEITGLAAATVQPNSGAQGEFTGMSVIRAYHRSRGEGHRNITLIPSSAHGTNPASATMAGGKVVVVNCRENGDVDLNDLREKAELHKDDLVGLMITYPSTHGVFEEGIREMCRIIHENGGQVYMDGANMNAQVGLTSPGKIGADICHLNLHKTFGIPHGGGGPGVGPICAAEHLAPFLPGHSFLKNNDSRAIHPVASTPWGSAGILIISYAYIKMLGRDGLSEVSKYAILNANYIKSRLEKYYPVLYSGKNGRVGHELIFDLHDIKANSGIDVEDVAKRLMDYGFHAPTMSFPVHGTFMVEPTESESKEELDRFCDSMISIYREIMAVQNGDADPEDNVLKNSPHPVREIGANEWQHAYSREQAAFPTARVAENKFWPAVGRIDNTYGDRHLVCRLLPEEEPADRDS